MQNNTPQPRWISFFSISIGGRNMTLCFSTRVGRWRIARHWWILIQISPHKSILWQPEWLWPPTSHSTSHTHTSHFIPVTKLCVLFILSAGRLAAGWVCPVITSRAGTIPSSPVTRPGHTAQYLYYIFDVKHLTKGWRDDCAVMEAAVSTDGVIWRRPRAEYCTCWYAGHCWQGFIVVLIRCIKKWYIQCWSRHGTRLSKHALWLHLKHHYLLISASQPQLWSRSWTWTRCEGCSVFFTIMNILVIISQWCRFNSMCQCYG